MSRPIRCRTAALALGALLAVAGAAPLVARSAVTPPRSAPVAARPAGLLDLLWGSLKALWGDSGCTIDPSGGHCANGTTGGSTVVSPAPAPNGCSIDPNGCAARR
jgi:hypothetical protein